MSELKAKHGLAKALVFRGVCKLYEHWLKQALKRAERVFANSVSVQRRFKQHLNVDTEVLYPPVDLNGFANEADDGYFLSTARLEPNKRVTSILAAFKQLPGQTLLVAGGGSLAAELQSQYADCENIHFVGWQSREHIQGLYNRCRALIYLPENEYFGIAPVEALAAGKPVIGVAEGGLLETLSDSRCGIMLKPDFSIEDLCGTIESLGQDGEAEFRRQHAAQFSAEYFYQSIQAALNRQE